MDKPAWVERILSDTQSHRSFINYIDETEKALLDGMRSSLQENNLDAARVYAGESNAWRKLRHQLAMYEREEEQYGIVQEQQGRPKNG